MRQGQQNRRGRGRHNNNNGNSNNSNNNRRGQNPLTRSYESNGPGVKIRGNPAHIAEKYISLARDAQTSGDPVLAENYLQHAEHYNRIILAFREQQVQQGGDATWAAQRFRSLETGEGAGEGEGDDDGGGDQFGGQGDQQVRGQEPQPGIFEGQPAPQRQQQPHQQREQRGPRFDDRDRNQRRHGGEQGRQLDGDRPQRDRDRSRYEPREQRGYSADRPERTDRPERYDRPERPERIERQPPQEPAAAEPAAGAEAPVNGRHEGARREGGRNDNRRSGGERFTQAPAHEQPEFLRRPVRRPRREAGPADNGDVPPSDTEGRE